MKKDVEYFGFIFWLHFILVLSSYLLPFLFNWKIIIVGVILLFIQYLLVGGCALNKVQFVNAKDVFYIHI